MMRSDSETVTVYTRKEEERRGMRPYTQSLSKPPMMTKAYFRSRRICA